MYKCRASDITADDITIYISSFDSVWAKIRTHHFHDDDRTRYADFIKIDFKKMY